MKKLSLLMFSGMGKKMLQAMMKEEDALESDIQLFI
jgi:hypothetical protein